MENKKLNQEDKKAAQEVTEISLEDLEQVAGGYSLREKKKVETTAISDDTISRIQVTVKSAKRNEGLYEKMEKLLPKRNIAALSGGDARNGKCFGGLGRGSILSAEGKGAGSRLKGSDPGRKADGTGISERTV